MIKKCGVLGCYEPGLESYDPISLGVWKYCSIHADMFRQQDDISKAAQDKLAVHGDDPPLVGPLANWDEAQAEAWAIVVEAYPVGLPNDHYFRNQCQGR